MASDGDSADDAPLPFVTNDAPSPDVMERRLVREMSLLSMQERSQYLDDVHGVTSLPDENPEMIAQVLDDLNRSIQVAMVCGKMNYYKAALEQNARYVTNRSFRLMFLRAELYDPEAASERMELHLSYKAKLFSMEKLTKDIELDDLDRNDLYTLHCGYIQQQPIYDSSGRLVVILRIPLLKYHTAENLERVHWYLGMKALRDESVQRKGMVFIGEKDGENADLDLMFAQMTAMVHHAIPSRIAACHLTIFDQKDTPAMSMLPYFLAKPQRLRFRAHLAKDYKHMLETYKDFGISLLPFQLPDMRQFSMSSSNTYMVMLQECIQDVRQRKSKLLEAGKEPDPEKCPDKEDPPLVKRKGIRLTIDTPIVRDDNFATSHRSLWEQPVFPEPPLSPLASSQIGDFAINSFSITEQVFSEGAMLPTPTIEIADHTPLTPRPEDVLLGRGIFREHPGTKFLQNLVASRHDEYVSANRGRKGDILIEILDSVFSRGGRFLRRNGDLFHDTTTCGIGNEWEQVDFKTSRKKVSNMLTRMNVK